MPSTAETNLRLELQATGENATTWGNKTNTNLELLSQAIAGAANVNVGGSGNITLTASNYASDEARAATLVLTGLLTGNRDVIVPTTPKHYAVLNQTTGAFTLTIRQSAGTGVIIPAGNSQIVCTSTTCVDALGSSSYGKTLIAAASASPARTILGATSIGDALFTTVSVAAARSTLGATATGEALFTTTSVAAAQNTLELNITGMVAFFASNAAPTGWLKANGALVSRATYPALWTFANASGNIVSDATWVAASGPTGSFSTGDGSTTFRIPDLRGEFVRGWDDARGVDSGRTIGSYQADALQNHTHEVLDRINAGGGEPNVNGTLSGGSDITRITTNPVTGRTAAETRPRNLALLACIKI